MARTIKLFPSYGSSLAMHLLSALERERIVADFVASYVATYKRVGILGGPARDRELMETIGREIAVAVVYEVQLLLPRQMGKKPGAALDAEHKKIVDAFLAELYATLGRAWRWTAEDRRQFQRDITLYFDWAQRAGNAKKAAKRRVIEEEDSPFIGRVALLLDPSMIDQARKVTKKFLLEMQKLAPKVLRKTLSRAISPTPKDWSFRAQRGISLRSSFRGAVDRWQILQGSVPGYNSQCVKRETNEVVRLL